MQTLRPGRKPAFIFPGQASQAPGMGRDLYMESEAAREVFEEADDILGRRLSNLIFTGDLAELSKTKNAQPAITVVSLAAWCAMEESTGSIHTPHIAAGHSLGEYSSLATTGVLTVSDTIRLVAERGRLMEEACFSNPGGMVAIIGINEHAMLEVCRQTGVYLSNINAPKHIIISGDRTRLAQAIDLASRRGARRAVGLKVGGAFHSALMAAAQEPLNDAIDSLEFHDPVAPIVANVTAEPLTTAEEVKDELKNQLQSCVRWSSSVSCMLEQGADSFIEIGPGSVLSNLVKKMMPDADVIAINNYQNVQSYAESWSLL